MGFDFEMQRNNLQLPDDYKPYYESAPGTYQLSATGMAIVGEIMLNSGVLDTSSPMPNLSPSTPARFVLMIRSILGIGDIRSIDDLLELESRHDGKVPAYKFSTNDGWLITQRECNLIWEAIEAHSKTGYSALRSGPFCSGLKDSDFFELLKEWSSYNRVASYNCGYRVW